MAAVKSKLDATYRLEYLLCIEVSIPLRIWTSIAMGSLFYIAAVIGG
jgi:hypothetical protein